MTDLNAKYDFFALAFRNTGSNKSTTYYTKSSRTTKREKKLILLHKSYGVVQIVKDAVVILVRIGAMGIILTTIWNQRRVPSPGPVSTTPATNG